MKKWVTGIGATALVAMAMGTMLNFPAPKAMASTGVVMQQSEIIVNGSHFSNQDKFVYNGTTYMPIWYIMQALKALGLEASWNGNTHTWSIGSPTGFRTSSFHGFGGSGVVKLYNSSNSSLMTTVETGINTQVHVDPASGVETTFFPIYDIQVILGDLGMVTDNWNGSGSVGVWTIGNQAVAATGSQTEWQNPPLPSGVTMTQYDAAIKQANIDSNAYNNPNLSYPQNDYGAYGPLANSKQWYPDPSDIFYNKQFPVSELKNGNVLQKSPYVMVTTEDGRNSTQMSYVDVIEYVGYGYNSGGAPVTYWKDEQVGLNHGFVQVVSQSLSSFPVGPTSIGGFPDLKAPTGVNGVNFGTKYPPNEIWAYGGGDLDTLPILNWNPLK